LKIILTIIFVLLSRILFAQEDNLKQEIDSLKKVIANAHHDTILIKALKNWDDLIYITDPKLDLELNLKIQKLSEKNLKKNISGKEKLFYLKSLSKALNVLGLTYIDEGNYDLALKTFDKALKIDTKINDQSGIAASHTNIGIIYRELEEYSKAIEQFKSSEKFYKKANDKTALATTYANLGIVYYNQKIYDTTLIYFRKSLEIRREVNDIQGIAYSYINIGAVFSDLSKLDSALYYNLKSLDLRREIGDQQGIAASLINIGNIYLDQSKIIEAKRVIEEAYKISEELKILILSRDITLGMYRLYKKEGDLNSAMLMYELHHKYKDQLASEENQKAVFRQQFKNEYENKSIEDSVKFAQEKKLSNAEMDKKNAELKVKENLQYFLIIGLIFIFIFAIFIYNRFRVTNHQKTIIEQKEIESNKQKGIIQEKQKEILDSINYAKRIQTSFLATENELNNHLKNYLVIYKPKDIVSGDFYWCERIENRIYVAVCDCTGHGIPGAFMSLLNISLLNEAVHSKLLKNPDEIFNFVRKILVLGLNKNEEQSGNDGMDGILFCIDLNNPKIITYAAANNSPLLIKNGQIIEGKCDKMPVGKSPKDQLPFSLFNFEIEPNDLLLGLTDGYVDQFGGEHGKKFKYSQLKNIIQNNHHLELNSLKNKLELSFDEWKGKLEQVDDVCVIGIKF
jgi:serine phosphatase RsbU (regulator of sigma subunit)/tetratricopeptide (TPR) repeat protein